MSRTMSEAARRSFTAQMFECGGENLNDIPRLRRLTLERLAIASASMHDPGTEIRNSMKGPTFCGPERIQVVVNHQLSAGDALKILVHSEGFETINLVARFGNLSGTPEPVALPDAKAVADALDAFNILISDASSAECRNGDGGHHVIKSAASVLCTVSDPVLPCPVKIVSSTPFLPEEIICLDDGEREHRVIAEAAKWRDNLPPVVEINASYGKRHCQIKVSPIVVLGERLDTMEMLRAQSLLAG